MKSGSADDELGPADEPASRKGKGRRNGEKGLGKVPGSGARKPTGPTDPDEIRGRLAASIDDDLTTLDRIRNGEPMLVTSPSSGKTYSARPTIDQKLRAIELRMRKYVPDLQSRQTQIDAKAEILHVQEPSNRELARAILDVLRTADMDAAGVTPEQANSIVPRGRLTATDLEPISVPTGGCANGAGAKTAAGVRGGAPAADLYVPQGIGRHGARPSDPNLWRGGKDALPPKRFRGSSPPPGPQPGDRVKVEGCRGELEVGIVMNDDRVRYHLIDEHGQRLAPITGKEQAEKALREFEETGSVDMSKRRK